MVKQDFSCPLELDLSGISYGLDFEVSKENDAKLNQKGRARRAVKKKEMKSEQHSSDYMHKEVRDLFSLYLDSVIHLG